MKSFLTLATISLSIIVAVMADFPGASMNFTYTTSSDKIAKVGFLKLLPQDDHNLTSLVPTLEQNVTAQMAPQTSRPALMVGICPQPQRIAMLVPTTEFGPEIDYIWRWGGSQDVPGAITYGAFGLTDPPSYDKLTAASVCFLHLSLEDVLILTPLLLEQLPTGEWRAVDYQGSWIVRFPNFPGRFSADGYMVL